MAQSLFKSFTSKTQLLVNPSAKKTTKPRVSRGETTDKHTPPLDQSATQMDPSIGTIPYPAVPGHPLQHSRNWSEWNWQTEHSVALQTKEAAVQEMLHKSDPVVIS